MSPVPFARLFAVAILLSSGGALAEPLELDLATAIDRAHRFAPDAVVARAHIEEARAGLVGAGLAFTSNPTIELGAGPRFSTPRRFDLEARIEQQLEPGRRSPRRQLARAEVDRARADGDAQTRELDLAVTLAFYDLVAADLQLALAAHGVELAERGAVVADRRRAAGDITDLDANLARIGLGRARAAMQAEAADRAVAVADLAALIGAGPGDELRVRGDLAPPPLPPAPTSLASRPDVRALDAQRSVARAMHADAVAAARPALGIWASVQREDATSIVLGGISLTLPVLNAGDGERATARARERAITATRETTLAAATRQVADALAAYRSAQRAEATFATEVAPLLDESERLLQKSLDAGQIAISELLVIRQELATGRRDQLEHKLALVKAAVLARHAMGVSP